MLHFVLVSVPAGVPSAVENALASACPPELGWVPDRATRWADPSGSVQVACWERDEPARPPASDLTIVSGQPWPHDEVWLPTSSPASILAATDQWSSPTLGDAYALVRIRADGTGLVTNDPLGLHPLYLAQSGGITVVGDQVDLVASLHARYTGREPARDVRCGAWLSLAAYLIGDGTGYSDVHIVPSGHQVRVAAGRAELEPVSPLWENGADDPLRDSGDVADVLAEDATNCLRHVLSRSPEPPWFELTGGKDSRLSLAIALRAGLTEDFRFVTYGPADLPDVLIAEQIAERFGFDLHRRSPGSMAPPQQSMFDRYRAHVRATSGMSNCHECRTDDDRTAPVVSSLVGEAFRTANRGVAESPPSSFADAGDRFRHYRKFGDAGLCHPHVAAQLVDEAVAYHLVPRHQVRGPEDLRPVQFLRCHLPRWQGPLVDGHQRRVLPLYSPVAIRGAFAMGGDARNTEEVHRMLITRASTDLAELPFANDTWRAAAAPQPTPVHGAINSRRTGQPAAVAQRSEVAVDVIDRCPESPLYDAVDRDALHAAAERFSGLRPLEKQQVLGAVTALIWLGGLEADPTADPTGLTDRGARA